MSAREPSFSESSFNLKIAGFGISNGEIDVNDLAPALLALGGLLQAANRVTYPHGGSASVKVKATSESSFLVDLLVNVQEAAQLSGVFDGELTDTEAQKLSVADSLLSVLVNGCIVAGSAYGLVRAGALALILASKGERIRPGKQLGEGSIEVTINSTTIITSEASLKLVNDPDFRKSASKFVSVLRNDGIDSLAIGDKFDKFDPIIIREDDVGYFDVPPFEEEIDNHSRRMHLQIVSVAFNEENKWRFTSGGDPFWAIVADEAFLKKIDDGDTAFRKHDYLVCEVQEVQRITEQGLKLERTIVKVYEHKQGWEQIRLFDR